MKTNSLIKQGLGLLWMLTFMFVPVASAQVLTGSFLLSTGFVQICDGRARLVSWENIYGMTFYARKSALYLGGPYGSLEDLYATVVVRETGNYLMVVNVDRYLEPSAPATVMMDYTPYYIPIRPGQHIDLTYYCLYLGGGGFAGQPTQGIQANFYLWYTASP